MLGLVGAAVVSLSVLIKAAISPIIIRRSNAVLRAIHSGSFRWSQDSEREALEQEGMRIAMNREAGTGDSRFSLPQPRRRAPLRGEFGVWRDDARMAHSNLSIVAQPDRTKRRETVSKLAEKDVLDLLQGEIYLLGQCLPLTGPEPLPEEVQALDILCSLANVLPLKDGRMASVIKLLSESAGAKAVDALAAILKRKEDYFIKNMAEDAVERLTGNALHDKDWPRRNPGEKDQEYSIRFYTDRINTLLARYSQSDPHAILEGR